MIHALFALLLTLENYEKNANEFWNKFYNIHDNKFFKDRNWLFTEFPELLLNDDEFTVKL